MKTIMMGNIEMVFPDIHMMNRFIGTCLKGPRARSQLLLILRFGSASLDVSSLLTALALAEYPGGETSSSPACLIKGHLACYISNKLPDGNSVSCRSESSN